MNLKLITLLGIKLDKDIYELIAPTTTGEIAIFPGHESLVTLAVPGALAVRNEKNDSDEKLEYFAISGGIIEINQKSVRVLVDEAAHSDDIVEAESKAALDRAIEMKNKASDQVELDKALQLVDRYSVRLKVAELRRRRRL